MPYSPIEAHGLIGDMHTAALVCDSGSIDWFCYPRFDSPSIFAAILDVDKGGRFAIWPVNVGEKTVRQNYWPETNVLVTRFLSEEGVAEVVDFMPVTPPGSDREHRPRILRQVRGVRGCVAFEAVCQPAFDYARASHTLQLGNDGTRAVFTSDGLSMALDASVPMDVVDDSHTRAVFSVRANECVVFAFHAEDDALTWNPDAANHHFTETVDYWRRWLGKCTYKGRWRDEVYRSALALKLMTYQPNGAIIAAPTTSLPEGIGGVRNWDYRYVWIRDAAFVVYALLRIGFDEEALAFMDWLQARTHQEGTLGPLQTMYTIDGDTELAEYTLDHLDGYKGSRPVRVGNGAYDQLQLDIYGELMDGVYLSNKYGRPVSYDFWTHLHPMLDWVCDNWQRKDRSIWEPRAGDQPYVFSRFMCWVALDRGIRLAEKRSFPAPNLARWRQERDTIYEEVQQHGWSTDLNSFVQSYGRDVLDASVLLMPLVFFMAPNDPRMLATLDAIMQPIEADHGLMADGLVFRYDVSAAPDGLEGEEGSFNMCTFWLVEALTRAGANGRPDLLEKARLLFERMLSYANHLGLYAEQTGDRGQALGNFPQAFTHLALISAAFNLDRVLGSRTA